MPIHKDLLVKVTAVFFALLLVEQNARALELDPEKIRVTPPDTDIAVVQNKYFTKSFRPELGLFGGKIMNEAYTETSYYGLRLGLFFTEYLGLEYTWTQTSVSDSADRKALNQLQYEVEDESGELVTVSPDPEVNPVNGVQDISLFYSPLYGKINVVDAFIIYTDLYLTLGYSMLDTEQGNLNGLSYGFGQRFYLTKSLSVRLDLKWRNYTEQRAGQDSNKTSYNMDFGISYFLF